MSTTETTTEKPLVLIVGAGLGGLTLGALLEKADIPYQILERIETIKLYGSTMCISAPLMPLFHQLEIAEEFIALAKVSPRVHVHQEDSLKPTFVSDFSVFRDLTGYESYTASRPVVHNLLLSQIPADKIHFGKRILTIKEEDNRMTVSAADGTSFRGDIVVGADGTYSAVRQRLYEHLAAQGKLPKEDLEDLPFSCTCLVGQTKSVDPEEFPILKESECHFSTILVKDKPYTIALLTTAQSTICWLVLHHLDSESVKTAEKQRFRSCDNSEWGPYQALAMCDETRGFSIPMGDKFKTLGDIYDNTPSDLISKVMLEEKVFETWYSGRTVLMGDSCHKVNPSGAQGAMIAMHDAAALANVLYTLPSSPSISDFETAFSEYRSERYLPAKESFNNSLMLSKSIERGFVGALTRFFMKYRPEWLWRLALRGMVQHRTTAGFLPKVPERGTMAPKVSPTEVKARAVFEKRTAAAAAAVSL